MTDTTNGTGPVAQLVESRQVVVLNGWFGIEPCRVKINHLPLSITEAMELHDDLRLALEKAGVEVR